MKKVDGVSDCVVDFASKTATVHVKKGTSPESVAAGLSGKFTGKVKGD